MNGTLQLELLNHVYREIAEELGEEEAIKIYRMYKGTQITFPKKLFSPQYVKRQVQLEYRETGVKQLAKKYNYSEKSIKRMIKDCEREKPEDEAKKGQERSDAP